MPPSVSALAAFAAYRYVFVTNQEFADWWSRYDVERVQEAQKVIEHPAVGRLTLRQTVLQVVDDSRALYLILYTPDPNTDTAVKLQKLAIEAGATTS